MVNKSKVKLMTGLAIFEKNEGREVFFINRYFKGDYVSGRLLRSFFCYTISYLLLLVIWVLYQLEDLISAVYEDGGIHLVVHYGRYYLIGLALYMGITWWVSAKRYDWAAGMEIMYGAKLKHLLNCYEKDSKANHKGGRTV